MKFQVTQKNLSDCLRNVTPFTDKNHQLDIIKNLLLKTNKQFLEISATNLETSIIEKVPGSCAEEGSINIPANLFRDYIQNLPRDEKIDLDLQENKLTINCKPTKAVVNGLSLQENITFPINKRKNPLLEILSNDLRENLSQVVFATHKDMNRPILTGVFLHFFGKDFYLAATDTYRLAEKRMSNILKNSPPKTEASILIPNSAILNLERILANQPNKNVFIYNEPSEKNILFIIGDGEIEITSSLLEGIYPNYRSLLPKEFTSEITVDRNDLINATKRTSLFCQENTNSIILSWQKKDILNIKSSASQIGDNEENIDSKSKISTAGDSTITLNAKYILEGFTGSRFQIHQAEPKLQT